jgi:hypothetical protein
MTPRDVESLTVEEFDGFCRAIDSYWAEQKRLKAQMEAMR